MFIFINIFNVCLYYRYYLYFEHFVVMLHLILVKYLDGIVFNLTLRTLLYISIIFVLVKSIWIDRNNIFIFK